jgi:hypothetical protein
MSRFAERFREEGMQQGEARLLERQLRLKFGERRAVRHCESPQAGARTGTACRTGR